MSKKPKATINKAKDVEQIPLPQLKEKAYDLFMYREQLQQEIRQTMPEAAPRHVMRS